MRSTCNVVGKIQHGTEAYVVWIRWGCAYAMINASGINCSEIIHGHPSTQSWDAYHSAKPTKTASHFRHLHCRRAHITSSYLA